MMSTDPFISYSAPDLFEDQFKLDSASPLAWQRVAENLARAAERLWPVPLDAIARLAAMSEGNPLDEQDLEDMNLAPVCFLLSGLALENTLKAALIARKLAMAKPGRTPDWGADGHDLLSLCLQAGITLDEEEQSVVTKLRDAIRWWGRYPQPSKVEDFFPRIPGTPNRRCLGWSRRDPEVWRAVRARASAVIDGADAQGDRE